MPAIADRLSAALADRYRIERELGAGGMATVYLAQDLRHDRKVAIKVLKPELAAVLGAERFVQEIKTTAAMSHPHILPLFDSGTADGFLFYVMPYIQGETIREKLNRETQFGVDEAVRIAREVADALDYAHRHGVIHRDIKPENILLHDGRAMVMDFGIALAVSAAAGGRMTETGLSLGTPHYMSPEQATADKEITGRSDIYSLASVLFEMLSGDPPHTGSSAQQVIMKIITDTPRPLSELRRNAPPNVVAALAKGLEKLPPDRFESAKAFGDALSNAGFTGSGATTPAGAARSPKTQTRLLVATAAIALIAIAVSGWALLHTPAVTEDSVVRMALELPFRGRLYLAGSGAKIVGISPQGDRIVYSAQDSTGVRAYTRKLDELTVQVVANEGISEPTFSPNGRWLAFISGNEIRKVQADGGPAIPVGSVKEIATRGLAWLGPDSIVIGTLTGLKVVSAAGGAVHALRGSDSTTQSVFPIALPDGKTLVFAVGVVSARKLAVLTRGDERATELDIPALIPLAYRDGHLLYVNAAGALMAIPFDLASRGVTGDAVQVEASIRQTNPGSADAALSETGTLLYLTGDASSQLMMTERNGDLQPLMPELRNYQYPRFSPDGRKVAVGVISPPSSDVWVYDRVDRTFQRLTTRGDASSPEWTPDGKRILFHINDNGHGKAAILWLAADGSGQPETLYDGLPVNEAGVSPDGQWLIYRTSPGGPNSRDIFARRLTGDTTSILLASGPTQESHPRVSPDGKWLAYQSNESNRFEVYVRPFPNAGSRTQVSTTGGSEPLWSRSGNELYYRDAEGIVAVRVTTGAIFALHERRLVSGQSTGSESATHHNYDVAPDGRLLIPVPTAGGSSPILVHNWGRVLREKLGAEKKP